MKSSTHKVIAVTVTFICVLAFSGAFENGFSFQDNKSAQNPDAVPTPGRVTMLDLGADKCIPCKMMAPILKELQQAYDGRADIVFIDVWKNKDQARKYGIRAIPTQIFFDENGREVSRHTGFMDKKTIVENLSKLGVTPPESIQDS